MVLEMSSQMATERFAKSRYCKLYINWVVVPPHHTPFYHSVGPHLRVPTNLAVDRS